MRSFGAHYFEETKEKENDKERMKSLSTSSKQDFSSRSQNIVPTVILFKTVAENIVLVISFVTSFISFYFLFLFHFMYFTVIGLFSYFLGTGEGISSLLYKHWHKTEGEAGLDTKVKYYHTKKSRI